MEIKAKKILVLINDMIMYKIPAWIRIITCGIAVFKSMWNVIRSVSISLSIANKPHRTESKNHTKNAPKILR